MRLRSIEISAILFVAVLGLVSFGVAAEDPSLEATEPDLAGHGATDAGPADGPTPETFLPAPLAASSPGSSNTALVSASDSYTYDSGTYSFDVQWTEVARLPGEKLFEAHVDLGDRRATIVQELETDAWVLTSTDNHQFHVDASTGTAEGLDWLRLDFAKVPTEAAPPELSGFVTFYFDDDRILHHYGFRTPSTAFFPIQSSETQITWQNGYQEHGSIDPSGTVHAGDDGSQLDAYGEWREHARYAVYQDGDRPVAHARIAQGDMLNYINDGRFRVDETTSRAVSVFNGFLDSHQISGDQLWALDAWLFPQASQTPAGLADTLELVETPWSDGLLDTSGPSTDPTNPPVVVGVPDSGINPYHEQFHWPSLTDHPCTYIEGYPCDVPALDLSIGEYDSYEQAVSADQSEWSSVQQGQWYWIPETPFVAVYCERPHSSGHQCILDENGHGTGTTSSVLSEDPAALIAFKEGGSSVEPMESKGIPVDVYSVSWGNIVPVPGHPDIFCANHERSPLFVTAAGNDPRSTLVDCRKGDPNLITVGGAYAEDDTEETLATKQPEVVSYYCRPTARAGTITGIDESYCGTSFAAPTVAGGLSSVIRAVREDSGYQGTLTDGMVDPEAGVSATDLRAALNRTATYDPQPKYDNTRITGVTTTAQAPWIQWGWGFYDGQVAQTTIDHLLGNEQAEPKSQQAQAYMQTQHAVKDTLYGDLS